MSYRPLVSIITPTYNHADYIGECLDSVKRQSYPNWEQVVVDDGSKDSTPDLVTAVHDPRVRLVRQDHQGITALGTIYNTALGICRGDLIAILEGDDSWPKTKLEAQVPMFSQSTVLLSWGRGFVTDRRGKKLYSIRSVIGISGRVELHPPDFFPAMLLDNFICPSSGVLLRRDALERIGGFFQPNGVPYVDLPTWLHLLSVMGSEESFVYTDQHVANWRSHPLQASRMYDLMAPSRIGVVRSMLDGLDLNQQKKLGLNSSILNAVAFYHEARLAMLREDWGDACSRFITCIGTTDSRLIRSRSLFGIFSCLLGLDLFRMVPNTLRFRLFGLSGKDTPPIGESHNPGSSDSLA